MSSQITRAQLLLLLLFLLLSSLLLKNVGKQGNGQ